MEKVDESGFFAVLLPTGRKLPEYTYMVEYDNGTKKELADPYSFTPKGPDNRSRIRPKLRPIGIGIRL